MEPTGLFFSELFSSYQLFQICLSCSKLTSLLDRQNCSHAQFLKLARQTLFSGEGPELWTSKKQKIKVLAAFRLLWIQPYAPMLYQVVVNDLPVTQQFLMYFFLPKFSIGKLISAVLRHF